MHRSSRVPNDHPGGSAGGGRSRSDAKLTRLGMRVFYSAESTFSSPSLDVDRKRSCLHHPYSGETEGWWRWPIRQTSGCPIIALTMENPNTIQKLPITNFAPRRPSDYRQAGTSRINQLAIIDILYSLLYRRTSMLQFKRLKKRGNHS